MRHLAQHDGLVITGPEVAELLLNCIPTRHSCFFLTQPDLFQEAVLRAACGLEHALHILGTILSGLGPVLVALDGTAFTGQAYYAGRPGGETTWWSNVCDLANVTFNDGTGSFSCLPGFDHIVYLAPVPDSVPWQNASTDPSSTRIHERADTDTISRRLLDLWADHCCFSMVPSGPSVDSKVCQAVHLLLHGPKGASDDHPMPPSAGPPGPDTRQL